VSLLSVCLAEAYRGLGLLETSLSATPGNRFMILLPGGSSLFEIQFTVASFVKVVILGLGLRNQSETKKKGETKCKVQSHTSPFNTDSTRLWPVSCGCDHIYPHWDMLLWSTFFEGTAKIHILVLIPVKARNTIDVTLNKRNH
jgi:hypothetical protein